MSQGDSDIISEDEETDTFMIRTKPCWICGQHSYLHVPTRAWVKFELYDVPISLAWPEGSAEDRQLLRTGIHPKCWDEEFPTNPEKEN